MTETETKSVGPLLRDTRESLGRTLDDAVGVTRIGKNYLIALEEERFDSLPSPAYTKGFLRAYAVYLGLSGDEVAALYERSASPRPSSGYESPPLEPDAGATPPPTSNSVRRYLIPAFLIVACVVIAYFALFTERGQKAPAAPPVKKAAPAVSPVQPRLSSAGAKPAAPPDPDKALDKELQSRPKGVILRLKVNEDGWLDITIDGNISQHYELKAGDLIEWKGDSSFALDMSNAAGVDGDFNGKPMKPLGERGKIAHIVLKGDGAPGQNQ